MGAINLMLNATIDDGNTAFETLKRQVKDFLK